MKWIAQLQPKIKLIDSVFAYLAVCKVNKKVSENSLKTQRNSLFKNAKQAKTGRDCWTMQRNAGHREVFTVLDTLLPQ